MKPNKEQYIDFIVDELKKGNVLYKDVSSLFCTKFHLTVRSFAKYWDLANKKHLEHQNSIKKAAEVQSIEDELNKLKTLQLTKLDRMKIAEGIAMGKAKRIGGQILVPSPSDQLKALDYLSKIESDYAPTRIANTNAAGEDVQVLNISMPAGLTLEFPQNTDESTT